MEKRTKKVRFTPGDNNYSWNNEIGSPFLKRSQISFVYDSRTKAKLLRLKRKYYVLFFSNEKEAYLSRNQQVFKPEPSKKDIRFQEEDILLGNMRQIRFSISKLLQRIYSELEDNPQTLFQQADLINQLCSEEDFEIPHIEAFDRISSWEQFMELLFSLQDSNDTHRFELMIAAIVQYADMCS